MARKTSQSNARKLIAETKFNMEHNEEKLREVWGTNDVSSIKEYMEALTEYAYDFTLITDRAYAKTLKRQLINGTLSQDELEVIFCVNKTRSVPELLWMVDKATRKCALINDYKQRYQRESRSIHHAGFVDGVLVTDLLDILGRQRELELVGNRLERELEAKLKEIDNEQFSEKI